MLKALPAVTQFIRSTVSLLTVLLLGTTGWLGYQHYVAPDPELQAKEQELADKTRQLAQAQQDLAAEKKKNERLEMAVRLHKVDHRVAQIIVEDQWQDDETKHLMTRFRFVELSSDGKPLHKPHSLTIEGDVVYIDYWVVKFEDRFVEEGDPLRGTSICLFRRIFGERQKPAEGFVVDHVSSQPVAYGRGAEISEFEKQIWESFWEYATDASKAQTAGVRSAHGEAPSNRLVKGMRYPIVLRASDGLSFLPPEPVTDAEAESL
jgi:hypothetical protein